ncbi:N-methylhydantoinase A/oxoprolinase/acetone carboxylase beta subunit [Lacrimispora xylanisolvens]|uniref:N-methylhydantoinase A/oxoprolinase/acetone carboxylase beta subunit n=1 Tax=Lacrimispora xylanisolvens TaxID=384636 RepID=A0A2S6HY67_9FIRM|nr:hydantoinase/oxoprolinase family protein [Hungatella xylanolytica]MBE5986105.1 hydantoinase/oxoprolinase family protein [Paenibacillaceae bacterium]PPK83115.1 N-methylhydantoinase A/oxoprolinase/acetone carboxylase beta subunit [Hungatella xylanolytica]
MAEREHRAVRMGIDVGGTYTKCVAMDNETHEIIGKNEVKTTHDDKDGVAAGVVQSFRNCMRESNISPEDVVFVAHSTTQATNAFIEGDVATVGVVGVAGGGLEGFLAKRQLALKDIVLDEKVGRMIKVYNTFIKKKMLTEDVINQNISELLDQGAKVVVASMAFGVDSMDEELRIHDCAKKKNVPVTMASDITKLYGLTRRTRTAAINASILPKMMSTANATESSVRAAGITVPLMIMRGDGGVMEINEMRKRPILTALSGPAASVMGSLMYLRASNAIYFEVGGTTTNIGVIKNGRPGVDYAKIGGHDTYINSLDVRILGCAGGSMVRISDKAVVDVGPRSAHIAGCEYACFLPEEEIEDPQIELVSPKPGDPADYVTLRLKNGKKICFTNTDAANVLGLIDEKYFAHGNAASARKAMKPVADKLGITVEELATQILDKDYEKVSACINALADKYKLDHDSMRLVGCGGGAASLVPYCAEKMGLQYSIPENAEVISSIGVALSMVRDVVERVIPNPSQEDIRDLKKEAADLAVSSGASPDTVEIHIEIDNQTGKVTAIATGSTEVKTTDLLKECDEPEARKLAEEDFGPKVTDIRLADKTDKFFVYQGSREGKSPLRIVDKKGFIKVQCSDGVVEKCHIKNYEETVEKIWNENAVFKTDTVLRPDFYVCVGPRVSDYSAVDLEQVMLLMSLDLGDREPEEEVLIIASVRES